MQDVIEAVVLTSAFNTYNIARLGDDAYSAAVALAARADRAELRVREVLAHLAGVYGIAGGDNGGVKVTRLAYGIPVGSNLEFADDATLQRALEGRVEM